MADPSVTQLAPATYQDVLDAPPEKVAELIDGVLYTFSRPATPHALASFTLGIVLGGPFHRGRGGPGGWWILSEPELHLGADILVPDLAGRRRERMPVLPDAAYLTIRPDWLCEVLSPSTRKIDLGVKRDVYAREGVPFMWLVDPLQRVLEAFELRGGNFSLIARLAEDQAVSLPPFESVSFSLGELWADSYPLRVPGRRPQVHDSADAA